MDDESSKFISEVWKYKPLIIILVVVLIVGVSFLVILTDRHRKKEHKKRDRTKHRDYDD
jgi:hypothetical protein